MTRSSHIQLVFATRDSYNSAIQLATGSLAKHREVRKKKAKQKWLCPCSLAAGSPSERVSDATRFKSLTQVHPRCIGVLFRLALAPQLWSC